MAIDDSLERARLHPDVLKNLNKNKKLKTAEAYSEDNPPPYPVTSVNGQTGDVDIPTVNLPVSVQNGGTGATTAAQAAKNLGVLPLGEVVTKIPWNADLNDYVLPGVYAISGNNIAATITNIPSQSAGTLRVFASIGDTITASSTWKYLIQEYITLSGVRYQRYGESGSGTAVTWGAWENIYTSADISVPVSVSQGGTGAGNAAGARTNLGAVSKSGDTMTGDLSVQKNGEVSIYSNNTAQGRNIRLCAGASGRAGIYDDTHGKWLIDYDSAGVLELGDALPIASGGTGANNAADARENLGLVRTLLWTNPTPSTLAAGTQNFSMSGYSQIEIECRRTGDASGTYFVRSGIGTSSSPVTVDLTTIRLDTTQSTFNALVVMTRTADVYSTGIVFSSGQMIFGGTYYKDWDSRAVPYRVWGIR